jgi:hypothetical protein
VHSWKESQMTDGLRPAATASAIRVAAEPGRPTAAAARVQIRMKSRRLNPTERCGGVAGVVGIAEV